METNLNKPHIEFTWPSETLADILNILGIEGLGSLNEEAGFFSSWPTQENWFLYIIMVQQQIPTLLEDEVTNIEEKLSAVETTFNHHLSGLNNANEAQVSGELRQLIDELEEIEKLISQRDSHAAYPYFARWFTLNLAVVSLLMKYENRYAQVRGVKLWWSVKYYLDRVCGWSYRERVDQINLQYTGALNNRVYVRDYRENMVLTLDVLCGGEEEVKLDELFRYLRRYAAWQHMQEILLPANYNILENVVAALSVTENSNTKQDQVLSVDSVWFEQLDLIVREITEYEEKCEDVIVKLINPAANLLQNTTGHHVIAFRAASGESESAAEDTLQKKKSAAEQALEEKIKKLQEPGKNIGKAGIQLLKGQITGEKFALTVIEHSLKGIASFIPGGAAVSLVTGMFFKFLAGGQEANVDPLVEHEKRMKSFIRLPWKKSWTMNKEWVELDPLVEGTARDTARVIIIEQCLRSTIFAGNEMYKFDAAIFAKVVLDAIKEKEEAKKQ
jgi:hypothetical protein